MTGAPVGTEIAPRPPHRSQRAELPHSAPGLAETPPTSERIDSWLRRRLRQVRWTEWKRPKARRHNLIVLGSSPHDARRWAGAGRDPGACRARHHSAEP